MPNPDDNKRAETAFAVWCGEGNESLRATAELTGIPLRTVQYYASSRDWPARRLAQMTPAAEGAALLARNRMRLQLPQVGEALFEMITSKRPLRDSRGNTVQDDDGNVVMDFATPTRDRVYAIKVFLEYAWFGIVPEEQRLLTNAANTSPTAIDGAQSVSDAAAAIIEATVHDVGDDKRRRR